MNMLRILAGIIPHGRQQAALFFLMLFSAVSLFGYEETSAGKLLKYGIIIVFWMNWLIAIISNKAHKISLPVTVLLLYTLVITIGSFSYNSNYTDRMLESSYYRILVSQSFVPHLFPLVILLLPNYNFRDDFRYILKLSIFLALIFICIYPFAFIHMINYSWEYNVGGSEWGEEGTYGDFIKNSTLNISSIVCPIIVLFWYKYISKPQWWIFLIVHLMELLLLIFTARRGGIAISLLSFFLVFGLYYLNKNNISKLRVLLLLTLLIVIGYIFYVNTSESFFINLANRSMEDTRSVVIRNFWKDMDTHDILYGRGWFGMYYDSTYMKWRMSIEAGYLALILRGGIIYLILYSFVLIQSAYWGIFSSNNILVKSLGLCIVRHLISLIPFGWPSISIGYMLIWIGVYICLTPKFRRMDDKMIYRLFFK